MKRFYIIGFLILMSFDTLSQISFKYASTQALPLELSPDWLMRLFLNPWLYGAIAGYLGAFVTWMTLLRYAPVGPSFAVFLVMVGLISAVGAPIAWLRCSIIGSAPIEMTGAMLGAQAYGVELNSPQYDLNALAASWWTMAVNGIGWLVVAAVLTPHLEKVRAKFGGGDARWLVLIAVAATTGCYGYLSADTIGKALRNYKKALAAGGSGMVPLQPMVATIAAGIAMAVLIRVSKKRPKLREYNLGLAMLAGMIVAAFF